MGVLAALIKSRTGQFVRRNGIWFALPLLLAALFAVYKIERKAFGDRRFDEGVIFQQTLISTETEELNTKLQDLQHQLEEKAEELDREREAAEALERQLAAEALEDPDAGSPGIRMGGRLRIEQIR